MTTSTEKKLLRKIAKVDSYFPKHHENDSFVDLKKNGFVNVLKFGYVSITEKGKKEI